MSNQAKDWQEGSYTVLVEGKHILVQKRVEIGKNSYGLPISKTMTAHACCSPEDEFSLSMGVALAMDRLSKELGKDKIEVGDKVKIKNSGLSYSTYLRWIKKNLDNVELAACFVYGQRPKVDETEYIVKAIAPWDVEHGGDKMLAYVQKYFVYNNGKVDDNEPCYLIAVEGLEKV